MTDVRLTATNPEDSSVVPVACNEKGELKLEEPVDSSFDGTLDGDLTVTGSAQFKGTLLAGEISGGNSTDYFRWQNSDGITIYDPTNEASTDVFKSFTNVGGSLKQQIGFKADGSAEFGGQVQSGGDPDLGAQQGVRLNTNGNVQVCAAPDKFVFFGLKEGTNNPTILMRASGSAEFEGDVAIGDSATAFNILGDAIALLPPTITEQFANIISSLPTAQPFTGDPTTLPADIPTPLKDALVRVTTAGKINLNSDGSATFSGSIQSGDIFNDDGSRLNPNGILQLRRDVANSVFIQGYKGGYNPGDITFQVNNDGSAEFKGLLKVDRATSGDGCFHASVNGVTKASIASDGSATFAGGKAGFTADGYLWCTTRRNDTVILDATSNGLATWADYTPPSRRDLALEKLREWSEKDTNDPNFSVSPEDGAET